MDFSSDTRRPRSTKSSSSSCCTEFNSQIFCSYIISVLSSFLIAAGFYLAILRWDHLWLILPISGSLLILVGACIYYSGNLEIKKRTKFHSMTRRRRNKDRGADHLMSANLSESRSVSQLSINMIPQYFSNSEVPGSTTNHSTSIPFTQILRINGQNFLILPLSNETSPPQIESTISLQSLMFKIPNSENQPNDSVRNETSDIKASPRSSATEETTRLVEQHLVHGDNASYQKEEKAINPTSLQNHESHIAHIPVATTSEASGSNLSQSKVNLSSSRRLLRRQTFSKSCRNFTDEGDSAVNALDVASIPHEIPPTSTIACSSDSKNTNAPNHLSASLLSSHSQPSPSTSNAGMTIERVPSLIHPDTFNDTLVQAILSSLDNSEERIFAMCSDAAQYDDNLIDTNNSTPPPSYSEVLLVENMASGGYHPSQNSDESEEISSSLKRKIIEIIENNPGIYCWEVQQKLVDEGVCRKESAPRVTKISRFIKESQAKRSEMYPSKGSSTGSNSE